MAALGLGAQVGLSLPFSREQEAEADILGINYMHSAGYDVKQAIPFWQRMDSERRLAAAGIPVDPPRSGQSHRAHPQLYQPARLGTGLRPAPAALLRPGARR